MVLNMKLATIGYEGLSRNSFFDVLIKNKINTLIDIRELPLSRKPGFSKGALGKQASSLGICYLHLGDLGCPRQIRNDYKADQDWERFSQRFMAYLHTQQDEIEKLLDIVSSERSCLLCFEANPYRCHRYYVAQAVEELAGVALDIIHLAGLETPVAGQQLWVDKLFPQ
jgi:uncharacterized protein (DUF488 family)